MVKMSLEKNLDEAYEMLLGANLIAVRPTRPIKDKKGRWLPRVKIAFEKRGSLGSVLIPWKKTFDTKKRAEDYAAKHAVMAIKQILKRQFS